MCCQQRLMRATCVLGVFNRSECTRRPLAGLRWATAICKAAHTSAAAISGAMAQPTILRECRSSTAARYSQLLRVRVYVRSHTQARFKQGCSNWRASTLGETAKACRLSVVCTNLRLQTGCSPLARIKVRTRYPSHGHALLLQCCAQPAAAVGAPAGGKGGFQVNTVSAHHGCLTAAYARGVIARRAYLENPAHLTHGNGLVLQLRHQLVAHLSSRAKKAEAFFNISTSPRSWRFSSSS